MTAAPHPSAPAVPPWRDVRVLRLAVQAVVVLAVAAIAAFMVTNFLAATSERGLGFGFSFLTRSAGFDISETPIPYSSSDTYARAFLVGLLNTLIVSVLGIIMATILGVLLGVARLSPNWLVRRIASWYVEIIRNTPLLVQLFILYFAVFLQLPAVTQALSLPGSIFVSQRGVFVPAPQVTSGLLAWLAFVAIGVIVLAVVRRTARIREDAGRPVRGLRAAGWLALLTIAAVGWALTAPIVFDLPVRERFNFTGGMGLSPEF